VIEHLLFTFVGSVLSGTAQQVASDRETETTMEKANIMKTLARLLAAFALLTATSTGLLAQTATPVCPLGNQPGYGRSLTPEQRAEHRAAMQAHVAEMRQKQADGSITAEEEAWLQQAEQRGGPCIMGTPRGPGGGKGLGAGKGKGNGQGQGKRAGLRDGTGPRCADGVCPNGNPPPRRGRQ
jgi:hypothetical protein